MNIDIIFKVQTEKKKQTKTKQNKTKHHIQGKNKDSLPHKMLKF